jgi:flagellum-specific ATP synthase
MTMQAAEAGSRRERWARYLSDVEAYAAVAQPLETVGTLARVTGLVLEARGVRAPVGSVCDVRTDGQPPVTAEVVGFDGDRAFLMPTGEVQGLASGARVSPRPAPQPTPRFGQESHPWRRSEDRGLHLPMGEGLLGRVVDSHGEPIDRMGPLADVRPEPMQRRPINAMDRAPVRQPLDTGVRAINTMLTVGRGQRIGLFAGTGVGKSVLLGMMARYTAADVIVVGLIGERGREVKEFIEDILGEDGRQRSVVVAAPADAPPLVRMQGATYATAIAEHFRDKRPACAAADGQPDALCDGAARDRAGDRRAARDQGLSAELLRQAAAAGRAQRQRPARRGLDHRLLHRAERG